MPGLSGLFARLFGGQTEPPWKTDAAERKIASRRKQAKAEYSENTLGWLLSSKSSPPSAGQTGYDLDMRPEMAPEAWERLQENIDRIPPMPEIWLEVQEILQQPDSSASDLGHCISHDPMLTSRILTSCNSFHYAPVGGSEVTNIPLAIARLGMDEASSIIFHSLAPSLGSCGRSRQEVRHIWFHGQAIARLSRILAESSHKLDRHEVSLVGMLHDIGKLAIACIEPQERLQRLRERIDEGAYSLTAEYDILGYTHIDAGIALASHWHMPIHVERFIAYHHHAAIFGVDRLPRVLRHSMMILQIAHLVLQHFMEGDEDSLQMVWQNHRRTLPRDAIRFIEQEMNLSLASEVLFGQMQAEIEKLKANFLGLFHGQK